MKIDRRKFMAKALTTAAAFPLISSLPNISFAEAIGAPWNGKSFIFDAMGELREVYKDSLVEEMLASGIRSICVTLADPKYQEDEAYDLTMEQLLYYNRFLDSKSQYYMRTPRLPARTRSCRCCGAPAPSRSRTRCVSTRWMRPPFASTASC